MTLTLLRSRLARSLALTLALAAPLLAAAETYRIDPDHAFVTFKVKHLGVSYVQGRFDHMAGTFVLDEQNAAASRVELTIEAGSVSTGNQRRDDHLKGPDFFDARQFAQITFRSTAMRKTGDTTWEVTGDLSLHGVTKSITVSVTKTGAGSDPQGNFRAGGELMFTIKRSDYGMNFMPGGIGDEVALDVTLEGIRQ